MTLIVTMTRLMVSTICLVTVWSSTGLLDTMMVYEDEVGPLPRPDPCTHHHLDPPLSPLHTARGHR